MEVHAHTPGKNACLPADMDTLFMGIFRMNPKI